MATKKFIVVKDPLTNGLVYYGKNGKPHYFIKKGVMKFNHDPVEFFELAVDKRGKPTDGQFRTLFDGGYIEAIEEEKKEEKVEKFDTKNILEVKNKNGDNTS